MPGHLLLLLLLPLTLWAQPEATIHQEYAFQLPKIAATWTPGEGLPSGLRIIPEDARIWGAPNGAGQYKFALHASDGSKITLDLKVNALWNLSLTPPQAAVGVPFSHPQFIGGGVAPYSFSASQLPPGLKISTDGLISGVPTIAGSYSALISVADKQGNNLNLPYELSVNAIGIVTSELPPAKVGADYPPQQLTAAAGRSGRREITRTPTMAGIYTFTVRIDDDRRRVGHGVVPHRVR